MAFVKADIDKEKKQRRDQNGLTEEEFLRKYKASDYPRPSLTVDVAMFDIAGEELKILLIRRKNHPWIGCRALPGGFVEQDECAEEAAARELEEETHLKGITFAPCGFYSTPDRDPRTWVVSRGFFAVTDGLQKAEAGDDAAEADWFTVHEESEGNSFALVLRFAEEKIRITGEYGVQPLTGLLQVTGAVCEDLACDHASIISDAYLALKHCREIK